MVVVSGVVIVGVGVGVVVVVVVVEAVGSRSHSFNSSTLLGSEASKFTSPTVILF